jgi:ParB-like chromosome segregation protein Spo0J
MRSTHSPDVSRHDPSTSAAAASKAATGQAKPAGWPVGVHPAATLFPMLHGAPLGELAADIERNGLREPIVVYQGLLLDGRNRLRGCELAGVEPRFVEWDGQGSLIGFVLSRNLHRRHLNESQRAIVAARAKGLFEEEAAERQAAGRFGSRGESPAAEGADMQKAHDFAVTANLQSPATTASAEAAALLNVSERSVATASKVLDRAEPEIVSAVESGSVAVSDAAAIVALSPEQQRQAIERVNCGEARTLRQAARRRRDSEDMSDDDTARTPAERKFIAGCRQFGKRLTAELRWLKRTGRVPTRQADCDHLCELVEQTLHYFNGVLARWLKPAADSDVPSARR